MVDGEVEYVHFRFMFLCSHFLWCENVRYWQSSKLSSSQGGAAGACGRPNMHCCQKKAEHKQSLFILALGEKWGLNAQQFLRAKRARLDVVMLRFGKPLLRLGRYARACRRAWV